MQIRHTAAKIMHTKCRQDSKHSITSNLQNITKNTKSKKSKSLKIFGYCFEKSGNAQTFGNYTQ